MPIYEYQCSKGHLFEEIQSFTAPHNARCPECGLRAKRKVSLASFHLKGSGWYSKDSVSTGKKNETKPAVAEKKESSDTGTEKTPSETSSEKPVTENTSPSKKEKPTEKKKKSESSTS